jgi:hypothetical protein
MWCTVRSRAQKANTLGYRNTPARLFLSFCSCVASLHNRLCWIHRCKPHIVSVDDGIFIARPTQPQDKGSIFVLATHQSAGDTVGRGESTTRTSTRAIVDVHVLERSEREVVVRILLTTNEGDGPTGIFSLFWCDFCFSNKHGTQDRLFLPCTIATGFAIT